METNSKEYAVDVEGMIKKVYTKIAIWNNEDGTSEQKSARLKVIAHEVIVEVLTDAFAQLEGTKTKMKVVPGEKKKEKKGIFSKIFKK